MSWQISPAAEQDYLQLRQRDWRAPAPSRATMLLELRETCDYLAQSKIGKPRTDGKLIYRGQQSRRYQYIVDVSRDPPLLVQVRGESAGREQGSERWDPRRAARRRTK